MAKIGEMNERNIENINEISSMKAKNQTIGAARESGRSKCLKQVAAWDRWFGWRNSGMLARRWARI
jgi:hypothetical protein